MSISVTISLCPRYSKEQQQQSIYQNTASSLFYLSFFLSKKNFPRLPVGCLIHPNALVFMTGFATLFSPSRTAGLSKERSGRRLHYHLSYQLFLYFLAGVCLPHGWQLNPVQKGWLRLQWGQSQVSSRLLVFLLLCLIWLAELCHCGTEVAENKFFLSRHAFVQFWLQAPSPNSWVICTEAALCDCVRLLFRVFQSQPICSEGNHFLKDCVLGRGSSLSVLS